MSVVFHLRSKTHSLVHTNNAWFLLLFSFYFSNADDTQRLLLSFLPSIRSVCCFVFVSLQQALGNVKIIQSPATFRQPAFESFHGLLHYTIQYCSKPNPWNEGFHDFPVRISIFFLNSVIKWIEAYSYMENIELIISYTVLGHLA